MSHIFVDFPSICKIAPPLIFICLPNLSRPREIENYYDELRQSIELVQKYFWLLQQEKSIQSEDLVKTHGIFRKFLDFCLREANGSEWFPILFDAISAIPSLNTLSL